MRSYIILGIYSLMVAFFYKWEASLFVLMASFFVEMILLFIGSFFIEKKQPFRYEDVGRSGAAYALFACTAFIYPMAYMMGDNYGEFSKPAIYGSLQPIVDYKWQILLMTLSLGVGYLADFKSLKKRDLGEYISTEVYRVCFLLFGIGLLGMMCLEGIKEIAQPIYSKDGIPISPFTTESKMIPIIVMISARMAIEVWYLLKFNQINLCHF